MLPQGRQAPALRVRIAGIGVDIPVPALFALLECMSPCVFLFQIFPPLFMAAKSKPTSSQPPAKPGKSASPKALKCVYTWGAGKADGDGSMKPLLGGKGANLAEMTRIGLPVPPGFTITTEVCTYYYANKRTYPPSSRPRSRPASPTWRRSWAPSSATPTGCRCSSPSAPAPAIPCPA